MLGMVPFTPTQTLRCSDLTIQTAIKLHFLTCSPCPNLSGHDRNACETEVPPEFFNYRGGHMGATKNIGVGHKKENLQFYYAVVKKERVLAVLVPSGAV